MFTYPPSSPIRARDIINYRYTEVHKSLYYEPMMLKTGGGPEAVGQSGILIEQWFCHLMVNNAGIHVQWLRLCWNLYMIQYNPSFQVETSWLF
jgi:hypothetical protein